LRLIRGSDIPDVEQEWVIEDIVADMELNGVLGDIGVGKTTFVLGILAHFSHDYPVMMLSNEDSGKHIKRTFKRLGGNLDNIWIEDWDSDLPWKLDNYAVLEKAVKECKPRIIGIDSYYSHAPTGKNTYRHEEVAPPLIALRRLADKYCPVVLIHHDNKLVTDNPNRKASGSQGICGTIRHNVRVHYHPIDPDVRVVAVFKTNIGTVNPPSLQFKIYPFTWIRERTELSARELLQEQKDAVNAVKEQRKKIDVAKDFLKTEMANGDRLAKDLYERAMLWHTISEDVLTRARKILGIYWFKNKDNNVVWSKNPQQ
jgi:hypothetical protein